MSSEDGENIAMSFFRAILGIVGTGLVFSAILKTDFQPAVKVLMLGALVLFWMALFTISHGINAIVKLQDEGNLHANVTWMSLEASRLGFDPKQPAIDMVTKPDNSVLGKIRKGSASEGATMAGVGIAVSVLFPGLFAWFVLSYWDQFISLVPG